MLIQHSADETVKVAIVEITNYKMLFPKTNPIFYRFGTLYKLKYSKIE